MLERLTDAELVRRARHDDPAAWRALVRRHTPMVYRLALRTLRNPADAEDTTQEVFLKMNKYLDSYDPTRPLPPWLGRITWHTCLRRLGERRPERDELGDAYTLSDSSDDASPESNVANREAERLLVAALDKLPAQDRFLIDLRYREGQSDVEVADATGMNVNTVRTRLFRARQALKKWLGPMLGKPEEAP
ncbi:MAG TPA: sigma-70 family RNA polymerase sigma factor [Myxococcota bacterium]|nr:sigma-70 family RNA polymerase sigma factor [Myxococcota bacterium]